MVLVGQGSGRVAGEHLVYPGWIGVGAALDLDFLRDRSWQEVGGRGAAHGQIHPVEDDVSLIRASPTLMMDTDGVWQSFGNNELRLTEGLGALLEPTRVGVIRNNTNQGQTGSSLPNNWVVQNVIGLTTEVVGVGVEAGLPFTRIRVYGTATGNLWSLFFDGFGNSATAAASGQTWTHSFYARLVDNSLPPTDYSLLLREYNGGTNLGNSQKFISLTPEFEPYSFTHTLANASTSRLGLGIGMRTTSGTSIDVTIDLFPWSVMSNYAGSPILSTGSMTTRAGDLLTCAVPDGGRAFVLDVDLLEPAIGVGSRGLATWNAGSESAGVWLILSSSGSLQLQVMVGGVAAGLTTVPGLTPQGRIVVFGSFHGGSILLGRVGASDAPSVTPTNFPTSLDRVALGGSGVNATRNTSMIARRFTERPITDFGSPEDGFAWAREQAQRLAA